MTFSKGSQRRNTSSPPAEQARITKVENNRPAIRNRKPPTGSAITGFRFQIAAIASRSHSIVHRCICSPLLTRFRDRPLAYARGPVTLARSMRPFPSRDGNGADSARKPENGYAPYAESRGAKLERHRRVFDMKTQPGSP